VRLMTVRSTVAAGQSHEFGLPMPGHAARGHRLYGMPVRPTGLRQRICVRVDPPPTHSGRWGRRNVGGKADIPDQILANTRFEVSAAPVQRKGPAANARFLTVQFHELCSETVAVRLDGRPPEPRTKLPTF
jgi:hypothetical protein